MDDALFITTLILSSNKKLIHIYFKGIFVATNRPTQIWITIYIYLVTGSLIVHNKLIIG